MPELLLKNYAANIQQYILKKLPNIDNRKSATNSEKIWEMVVSLFFKFIPPLIKHNFLEQPFYNS